MTGLTDEDYNTNPEDQTYYIYCNGTEGNVVRLIDADVPGVMNIAEIEIFQCFGWCKGR